MLSDQTLLTTCATAVGAISLLISVRRRTVQKGGKREDILMQQADAELRQIQRQTRPTGVTVCALYHYPIKSCAGIKVDKLEMDSFGFKHDRRWAVVEDPILNRNSKGEPQFYRVLCTTVYSDTGAQIFYSLASLSTLLHI